MRSPVETDLFFTGLPMALKNKIKHIDFKPGMRIRSDPVIFAPPDPDPDPVLFSTESDPEFFSA